ncbi:MAG: hypothetical protein HYZ45_08745 [Burkholderiales bacterium]|nr:hypothetical protein [Burkholderiales bacterium]
MIARLKFARPAVAILLTTLVSACGEKSEEQQLAEMRSSVVYSQYRLLSENGMRIGLNTLEKSLILAGEIKPDAGVPHHSFSEEEVCVARLLLAYSAVTAEKNTVALAETDIVSDGKCPQLMKSGAGTIRSVIFQHEKWPNLAASENDKAMKLLPAKIDGKDSQEKIAVFHILMVISAFKSGDMDRARLHVDAIALMWKKPWISAVALSAIQVKQGNFAEATRSLKRVTEDPSTPPKFREALREHIAVIEAKTGNVDSTGFAAKLLALMVWEALKQSSSKYAVMEAYAENQINQQLGKTVDKAKGLLDEAVQKAKQAVPGK